MNSMAVGQQVFSPKEQKEILSEIEQGVGMEKVPVVERKAEMRPEMRGWIRKLEEGEEIQLPQPVTDGAGQPIVQAAAPQQPQIILPLDEDQFVAALRKTVYDSIRWLAEWCRRLLKMFPGRIAFKKFKTQSLKLKATA